MDGTPRAQRFDLQAFSLQAMRELIASSIGTQESEIDDALLALVTEQCMGNPFYVTSSLKEWLAQGKLTQQDGVWKLQKTPNDDSGVSVSVHDGLLARIRALDKQPLQIASVAAVIGKVIDVNLLQDVLSDWDEFTLLDALDDLFSRRILVESSQARRVEFTHDLVREVALEQISQSRKHAWHRRVGTILEQHRESGREVPLAKLAEHFHAAGDSEKAFNYLLEAGITALNSYAFQDAIELLTKARQISKVNPTTTDAQYRLWMSLAAAYLPSQQPHKSEAYYKRALEIGSSPEDRAASLIGLGNLAMSAHRQESTQAWATQGFRELNYRYHTSRLGIAYDIIRGNIFAFVLPEALRRLFAPSRDGLRFQLLYQLVHAHAANQQNINLMRYIQASNVAFITAYKAGRDRDLALALSKHAINLSFLAFKKLPMRMVLQAEALSRKIGDMELVAYTIGLRGMVAFLSGNVREAEQLLKASLEKYSRLGESFYRQMIVHFLRHLYEVTGQVEEELEFASEELRIGEIQGDKIVIGWAFFGLANACARSGRMVDSLKYAQESEDSTNGVEHLFSAPILMGTYGFALIQASRYEEASRVIADGIRKMERELSVFDFSARNYPLAIEARLGPRWHTPSKVSLIPVDGFSLTSLWLRNFFAGRLYPNTRHLSLRARGRLAAARGKFRKSARLFTAAIERAEKHGARYEHARALLDRSLVNPATAEADRKLGFEILNELGCVIPEAEMENFQ